MMYTVGHIASYSDLVGTPNFCKLGECTLDDGTKYGGGIAFTSIDDAREYLKEMGYVGKYEVYGLDTEVSNTRDRPVDGPYRGRRSIIKDCPIVVADGP